MMKILSSKSLQRVRITFSRRTVVAVVKYLVFLLVVADSDDNDDDESEEEEGVIQLGAMNADGLRASQMTPSQFAVSSFTRWDDTTVLECGRTAHGLIHASQADQDTFNVAEKKALAKLIGTARHRKYTFEQQSRKNWKEYRAAQKAAQRKR